MTHTATYDPGDDKIRITPAFRLDRADYDRVKAAGYRWAPMQKVFFAVWSPKAEDIALEFCGEIEDEDKSLVERAEERAERFEEYSDNRRQDADRAHAAVKSIADNIPLGQPILVGHHSEKHARRDAEKIENGMRKAVKMWDTAQYWKSRAAGALAAAKYKERPDVRSRRIKTLEAELRKCIASYTPLTTKERPEPQYIKQQRWDAPRDAEPIPHVWVGPAGRGGRWVAVEDLDAIKAGYRRWEDHLVNRIAYETAMLGEQIGVESFSERFDYQVGGKIRHRELWLTILKLNKKDGQVISVSTNNKKWPRVVDVEDIAEYQPPKDGAADQVKAALKRPPLCNYPGEGFATCTAEQWKKINKDYKSQSHRIEATETHGAHCVRWAIGVYLNRPPKPELKPGEPHYKYEGSNWTHNYFPVFVTDLPRKDPPAKTTEPGPALPPVELDADQITKQAEQRQKYAEQQKAEESPIDALRDTLKAGIQVVTANQLFPTPKETAEYMCDLAGDMIGKRILEPSAGTGNLIDAIRGSVTGFDCLRQLTAVEINGRLADLLSDMRNKTLYANDSNFTIYRMDFLECTPDPCNLGTFDRILMNPPFENGADIKHLLHARTFLKPGGRLVAICANGPRQQEKLKPIADYWEELPEGTFAGTGVRTALLVMNAPTEKPTLAQDAQEAERMTYAGRSMPALRHAKTFDHTRLEESPLFAPHQPKLF